MKKRSFSGSSKHSYRKTGLSNAFVKNTLGLRIGTASLLTLGLVLLSSVGALIMPLN